MKILIPYFEILGTDSYPDDFSLFSDMELIDFDGTQYWLCDYAGNKNLQSGATYTQYKAWLELQPPSTGIRIITKAAFRNRFTYAERRAVNFHVDFMVKDIYEDLLYRAYVNLDDPQVRDSLDYLVQPMEGEPVLANEARVLELLYDGTEYERYTEGA